MGLDYSALMRGHMFSYFKQLSLSRKAWAFLAFSAFFLECTALYFQHGMGLQPCVMCIYERVATLAILIAGIIGVTAPRFLIIRLIAIAIWLGGSIKGLILAIRHTGYQLDPKPWDQCPLFPDFPQTLPLDQWLPQMFAATGSCKDIDWQLFGFTMPQWLILAFSLYILFAIIVTLSQFKRINHSYYNRKNLFH